MSYCLTADGLKEVFVNSYADISARIDEGTVNRYRPKTGVQSTGTDQRREYSIQVQTTDGGTVNRNRIDEVKVNT